MGIRFHCEHCKARLNVKSHQAGMQGRCPKCGGMIQIPASSEINESRGIVADQKTLQFSNTELLLPEELGGIPTALKPRSSEKRELDAFTVSDDTDVNAGDDSISLTADAAASPQDSASFLLGKPKNRALLPDGPNPIEEAPNKVWYIRNHKHSEIGPIRGSQLQQMLDDQEVLPGSYLWREDWDDWERGEAIFASLRDLPKSKNADAASGKPQKKVKFKRPKSRGSNSTREGSSPFWIWAVIGTLVLALGGLLIYQIFF